jgi:hypothetical protein
MTQAYNLSQLANKVNTSGQLNPATGLSAVVPVANGGTGLATLTANNVILGNGSSAPTFVAPGTAGNALVSNGTTWVAGAPTLSGTLIGYQVFTSTGSYTKATNNPAFVIVYVVGGGGGVSSSGTGGTSSFGTFCSATGGALANTTSAANTSLGGTGSGGDVNATGESGLSNAMPQGFNNAKLIGGSGAFGLGYGNGGTAAIGASKTTSGGASPGGGGGAMKKILASAMASSETVTIGAAGTHTGSTTNYSFTTPNPTAGIVIVWEYQ